MTETHLAWKIKGPHRNSSPLVIDDDIYVVSDNGVVSCLDVATGEQHWQKRLGGDFSASPLYADGKIYVSNEAGVTFVLQPDTSLKCSPRTRSPPDIRLADAV